MKNGMGAGNGGKINFSFKYKEIIMMVRGKMEQ
jgi:hypothetical protein